MDLFDKAYNFHEAEKVIELGLYPYFRVNEGAVDTTVIMNGRKTVMIGSNNYLGLTSHPEVKEAAIKAVEKYGTGCTGSRFLNGTIDLHVELEERLARFMKKEASLVFTTGFTTNLGVISTIVGKNDIVISDRTNHASILDGCRMALGKLLKFRHNDMEDLERILINIQVIIIFSELIGDFSGIIQSHVEFVGQAEAGHPDVFAELLVVPVNHINFLLTFF